MWTDVLNEQDQEAKRIIYSTRTGSAVLIKDETLQALQNAQFYNIQYSQLNTLFNLELIVPAQQDEFSLILDQNVKCKPDDKMLSITIQPSANCQLGCHYCGQVHSKQTLSDAILPQISSRIKKQLGKQAYKQLMVTWFGAEPLMAYQQIRTLSKDILQITREAEVDYKSMMITNAVSLKKEIARELIHNCHVTLYQITVDGMKAHHDQRRTTKVGGEPTFDIIMNNLLDMTALDEYKEHTAGINLRMNIDRSNFESVPDFIDLLASYGFPGKNMTLNFSPVMDWGGNGASAASLDKHEYASKEIDWTMQALSKGFKTDTIIPQRVFSPCMVTQENDEVYDAQGNIFACYELPYTPKYEAPEYLIGNLKFDEATFNKGAIPRNWFTDIKENISWCPKCKFFPVCGGGCPKQWYNKEPACPSFKFNIEERLVLQHVLNNANITELI